MIYESARHLSFQFALRNSFSVQEDTMNSLSFSKANCSGSNCPGTPEEILQSVFGYERFRPMQREAIQNILEGRDTLAVMPTGGGKSLCYEIPALMFSGITVIVSPLIALMQDQAEQLAAYGIPAACLNSSTDWNTYRSLCEAISCGKIKLLYVSPEGLGTQRIRSLLKNAQVSVDCITIDEAHCISEWGHDFRPDYLEIASIRAEFPRAVFLALTATATKHVQADIVKNLRMDHPEILTASFNRPNLFLQAEKKTRPVEQVLSFLEHHRGQSGIIYCFSRKQVDELTLKLTSSGIKALSYHAGLSSSQRAQNQRAFISDKADIMVATVAFGMGINKPDVRFVIHFDMPKSIEQYYQEIGRAGRDGLQAEALLLFGAGDLHKIRYFFSESADASKAELLLQEMLKYAEGSACRRKTLLSYFGEPYSSARTDAVPSKCCCDVCASAGTAPKPSAGRRQPGFRSFPKKQEESLFVSSSEEDSAAKAIENALRLWRRKAADELNVPPYVIFGDKTLFDIARKKPASIQELVSCYGIGEIKAEKFGYYILRIVKEA